MSMCKIVKMLLYAHVWIIGPAASGAWSLCPIKVSSILRPSQYLPLCESNRYHLQTSLPLYKNEGSVEAARPWVVGSSSVLFFFKCNTSCLREDVWKILLVFSYVAQDKANAKGIQGRRDYHCDNPSAMQTCTDFACQAKTFPRKIQCSQNLDLITRANQIKWYACFLR